MARTAEQQQNWERKCEMIKNAFPVGARITSIAKRENVKWLRLGMEATITSNDDGEIWFNWDDGKEGFSTFTGGMIDARGFAYETI